MKGDMLLVYGSIAASLVLVPAFLTFQFVVRGLAPTGDLEVFGVGLVAMLPGLLMGATSLWIAARG